MWSCLNWQNCQLNPIRNEKLLFLNGSGALVHTVPLFLLEQSLFQLTLPVSQSFSICASELKPYSLYHFSVHYLSNDTLNNSTKIVKKKWYLFGVHSECASAPFLIKNSAISCCCSYRANLYGVNPYCKGKISFYKLTSFSTENVSQIL